MVVGTGVQIIIGLTVVDLMLIAWLVLSTFRGGGFESKVGYSTYLEPTLREMNRLHWLEQYTTKEMFDDDLYGRGG